jgi:hypothetical protein
MGVKAYTYVGPFLECQAGKVSREVPGGLACPRCSHQRPLAYGRYCPDCGTPGEEFTHKEFGIDEEICDLPERIEESLYQLNDPAVPILPDTETHIWVPNDIASPGRSYGDGSPGADFRPMVAEDIKIDLKYFRVHYSREMEIFTEIYGEGNCRLRWGVVNHWH